MANSQSETTEIVQRTRRIETRLTQLMIGLGIETPKQRPEFEAGAGGHNAQATIRLPSPHTSLKEIASAVPDGWTGPIRVCIGDTTIASLTLGSKLEGDRS